jgi:NTE family protein
MRVWGRCPRWGFGGKALDLAFLCTSVAPPGRLPHAGSMVRPSGTALALQGGGVHGAFAWGVLDTLLADGLVVDRVCGVSSGALLAAMFVQGHARGGVAGGRAAMRLLWQRVAEANTLNPLQNGPLERWLFGWDLSNNWAWQGMEAAMRLFSPAQLNPFNHNPLRAILDGLLDRDALASASAIPLTVGVTDVESGGAALFGNAAITTDVLLASACVPFVFPAVQIDGRAYWDGGYSGNPPLAPLLSPMPKRLVLIRAQPTRRTGVPGTQAEILNRLNEIACHNVLRYELEALPAALDVACYSADDVLGALPISSKMNADQQFIGTLFAAGMTAAHRGHDSRPEAAD